MWGGGSDGGIFLTCKKNPVCQMRFKDYSWDRCQKKALLFGKITVTFEGQIMNAESRTGVCEEPQPTLPKPVLLALSKHRMWLQSSTEQIICTDNRPLTSFNLPAYWESILLAVVIKVTKKRTASFFFFPRSQLESYKSICWEERKWTQGISLSQIFGDTLECYSCLLFSDIIEQEIRHLI